MKRSSGLYEFLLLGSFVVLTSFIWLSPVTFAGEHKLNLTHAPRTHVLSAGEPTYNLQKPIALDNRAGWVVSGDILFGSYNERFAFGFSFSKKKVLWWLPIETLMVTPSLVIGEDLVAGTLGGSLMRLDSKTGEVLWRVSLDSHANRRPLFDGANIFVLTATQHLYSINYKSGKTNWIYDAGLPEKMSITLGADPINLPQKVILGLANGEVSAIDKESGKKTWNYRFDNLEDKTTFSDVVGSMVVVRDQLIYTRFDGYITSVPLKPGATPLWQSKLPLITTSYVMNDQIYVAGAGGVLKSFSLSDGKVGWETTVAPGIASITGHDQTLYLAANDGKVFAVNRENGSALWFDDLAGRISSGPFIFDNQIFFGTGLNNLYGYQLTSRSGI